MGGGPAGATVGAILADHGRRVLILEKGGFPRHHIGESLMPETYGIFKRLGMLEKLRASHFPVKESVQFVSASGRDSQPFFFTDRDPGEWSRTWQVPRDRFDKMMLDNAREHGAQVREQANVKDVLFDGDRAIGVRAMIDGETVGIPARVVVDATGMNALLSRKLGIRQADADLKNASIYAYFKNAHRDTGRNAGATIIINTPDRKGWFWVIPLDNDITSIGVVAPPSHLFSGRGDDPLATFFEEAEDCPGIQRRLEKAECVSRAFVTSDFSACSRRLAGDGWVLVGDAFGFLDPVYSSGVMLALASGEMAADAIHDALLADDPSAERLGRFAPKLVDGIQMIRQLVYAFYNREFSFADFLRKYPQYHDDLVRVLIGDVFKNDLHDMFSAMKEYVDMPNPIRLDSGASIR